MSISTGMVVATRHWRRVCQATLVNYGISEACAMPLLIIGRLGEGVRQVTVAHAAGMESPSLVRLLDQLCKAGYVRRCEDASDRRAKTLSLTDTGRALVQAKNPRSAATMGRRARGPMPAACATGPA